MRILDVGRALPRVTKLAGFGRAATFFSLKTVTFSYCRAAATAFAESAV
jgi:hypothetical protein